MANVSQLQPALPPQVQTNSSEATEKDADFLALRLVNKRARLRLSSNPLDLASFPGKANLFAIINSKGWFAAVTREAGGASSLILSPLAELRSALAEASADEEQLFRPQRRVPITGAPPHILTFACNGSRILVGLLDGSIHVYTSDQLFSSGEAPVQPIHVFAPSLSAPLLSIQPNPGDIPDLIAVLRDCANSPGSLAVELLDVQKLTSSGGWMAGKSPSTTPTSISWSPKGKQLALGLQSGDIVTFSPTATATPKSCIPHSPSANNMSVIAVHWLSTTSFHTIYAPPSPLTPDVAQAHFHVSLDSKSNSAQDIRFNSPYLPYPGLRPPGEFVVCLRGWDPSKVLLFIGDSTSSDIGLIGSIGNDTGETWHNFSLEETSTPSLPLDKDENDTVLLGIDVDLTSSESYRHSTASGEALELPAHPIMYVYASDGTILGWHVLNVTGASYPGMATAVNESTAAPSVPPSMVRELSSDMQTTPAISPTTSGPMETSITKTPSTVFGQPSPFGSQDSGFGTSGPAFGQPSAFGQQPVFSKPSSQTATPVFGSTTVPSTFGQPSTPAFSSASTVSSGGFGAFSSAGPAKFGQTTFGFGGPSQTTTPTQPPPTSVPEESMADDAPSLTGFGLGAANSEDADSKPSIFGKPSASSVSPIPQSTLIKPGTGFGAFGGFDQKQSPFVQPASAFGTKVFQSTPDNIDSAPSLGGFGLGAANSADADSKPSIFGKPTVPASSAPQSTNSDLVKPGTGFGAFGGFDQKQSPFAKPPVFASQQPSSGFSGGAFQSKPEGTPSTSPFGTASSFSTGQSTFGKAASTSAFGQPSFGQSSFGQFQTGNSVFGKTTFGGAAVSTTPAQPQEVNKVNPVSVFTLSTTPSATPPQAASSQPTFGASSMPGGAFKSAFPPTTTTPTQPPPASSNSGFGAFAGGGGGFAAFSSGGNKSFSDLLRSAGEDKTSKPASSDATPTKPVQSSPPPVSTTPASTPSKEPSKEPTPPPVVAKIEQEGPEIVEVGTSEVPAVPKERPAEVIVTPDASLESISSSTTSSFVRVEEDGEVDEGRAHESQAAEVREVEREEVDEMVEEEGEEDEESGEADDDDSEYLPSSEPEESEEESEGVSESAEEEVTEERVERVAEPTDVPLPITPASTRSPSTTPKAEHPKISVSVSPPPQGPSASGVPRVSPVRELSTTPPDSPVKDAPPGPVSVQVPKPSPPPSSPFGLVPRANNRPVRSSPLASAPLVPDGETEKLPAVSQSAPPTLIAQPAATKAPFGQWTPPPSAKPAEVGSTAPKAPSLSSLFAPSGEKPTPSVFVPKSTPPPVPPLPASTDKTIAPTGATTATSGPSNIFSLPAPFASSATPTSWGTPARSGDITPPTMKAAQPVFGGQSMFKVAPAMPLSSSPSPSASPFPSFSPGPSQPSMFPKTPSPAQTPSPTPEQGMQAECLLLVATLTKELENLKERAAATSVKTMELRRTSGRTHRTADLGDPLQWVFGDIEEYGRVLVDVQLDVKKLKLERVSLRKALKELDSNILKVNTRKEELARFHRAKTDAEYAKMLKVRTLAPEYAESQSQLRKSIWVIRDRVQKLEDHLQSSKKRINEVRTGRPSLRPPSLDTVNRAFRNIDIAIDQQKQDMSRLRQRMGRLEISGGVSARDQLTLSSSQRPLNVTPNVAVTTAAALNAERSAQRLKKALLASRAQPLLNTTATASPLQSSFQTPQKSAAVKAEVRTPEGAFSLPTTPMSFPSSIPDWTPPPPPPTSPFSSPVAHDITPSRSRGATKHHQKPIALKKNGSPSGPQPSSSSSSPFGWGPLEPIKPVSQLPFAIRPAGSG